MREIIANQDLLAYCGLYCGACKQYLAEKCEGCKKNIKSEKWCQLKNCCKENNYQTCADCSTFATTESLKNCKKFNNIFSKIFSLLFRSDRASCIGRIREVKSEKFVDEMAKNKICNKSVYYPEGKIGS